MTSLVELKRQAEAAEAAHKSAVRRLYHRTPGGQESPKYDPAQMDEMRRKLDSERNRALGPIEEAAKGIHREYREAAEAAARVPGGVRQV